MYDVSEKFEINKSRRHLASSKLPKSFMQQGSSASGHICTRIFAILPNQLHVLKQKLHVAIIGELSINLKLF